MSQVLLSTAYFPPIIYFKILSESSFALIENEENFHKQTYRNRCVIYGANGPLNLTVPVQHDEPKIKIANLGISYHSNWQLIHLRAIESAYRNSPFYEYYIDDFSKFYSVKYSSLLEFNTEILKVCICLLRLKVKIDFTTDFLKEAEQDFRYSITPKKIITDYSFPEYHQVFMDKYGFIENLSILDLIFNVGPESTHYLNSIHKKNGQK